ncbi:DUF3854 domain-containing protein [Botrimarina sp.]|uniref:DUF3854 domain-containing protein n=1 Tax=Botrimarina sp. TaxID=2795802 RepID=UPI0032EB3BBE
MQNRGTKLDPSTSRAFTRVIQEQRKAAKAVSPNGKVKSTKKAKKRPANANTGWPREINEYHRLILTARGITPETARAEDIRSKGTFLRFAHVDIDGELTGYVTKRHDKPPIIDGRPVKYQGPPGEPSQSYIPRQCVDEIWEADPPRPIYITEGPIKALALTQYGYLAIGLPGVFGFKVVNEQKLKQELRAIDWTGRSVYIAFDYDTKTKTQTYTRKAARMLAGLLLNAGAEGVYWVSLPPAPDGGKQGIDDFGANNGDPMALQELIDEAQEIDPAAELGGIKIIICQQLPNAACQGPMGDFLRGIVEHTEATAIGILLHLLLWIAAMIGRGPTLRAGSTTQPAHLNVLLLGGTSGGRKGTASRDAGKVIELADPRFYESQMLTGLSTGEGLIALGREEESDKRFFIEEEEFGAVLTQAERQGNILSPQIRKLNDGGRAGIITKGDPIRVKDIHVCIIGHCTPEEFKSKVKTVEFYSGFVNRFLIAYSHSTTIHTDAPPPPASLYRPLIKRIRKISKLGSEAVPQTLELDAEAQEYWDKHYPIMRAAGDAPGLQGAIVARGYTFVLRLALIYALVELWESTDETPQVAKRHLEAGMAIWRTCERATLTMLAGETGDPLSEEIVTFLQGGSKTTKQLREHFGKKMPQVKESLKTLVKACRVRTWKEKQPQGAGRPTEYFTLADSDE